MTRRIRIHPKALKEPDGIRADPRRGIVEDIRELGRTFSTGSCRLDVKRLRGSSTKERLFRLRSGDHRVVFQADGDAIWIARVSHRDDVYQGMD